MGEFVLTEAMVAARRASARCLSDGRKASLDEEAARYVDERGFAPIMRLRGCDLPSLSEADVREPWQGFDITDGAWRWKEVLPEQRRCAYGRFLLNRGFFISWRLFPAFYRLYGHFADESKGTEQRTAREEYADGLLGRLEWLVLETIAERGPVDSRLLWQEVKRAFGGDRSRFERALVALQAGFRVMVAGGSLEGWSMHRWDLVERQAPAALLGQLPGTDEARRALCLQYAANSVVCTVREVGAFFRWDLHTAAAVAAELTAAGLLRETKVEGWKGTWLSTAT
jgi:hypothetical protein